MIIAQCQDCGQEFYCNADKNNDCESALRVSKYDGVKIACWCPKCSKKKWGSDEYPQCYVGIADKEKVQFD